MIVLIGGSFIILAASVWLLGFNACTVAALVSCLLFAGRKFGYFCKMKDVLTVEGLGIFFYVTFQLILKRVDIGSMLLALVLRGAFLLLVYYDTKFYVYVTEERRRGVDE